MITTNADLMSISSGIEGEWIAGNPSAGPLPTAAGDAYKSISAALAKVRQAINGTLSKVEQLRADDLTPEKGKARLRREALDQARATVTEETAKVNAALTVMRGVLTAEALPKVPFGQELIARADAQMILDRAEDPHQAMIQLAERGDAIGALVASSWGADYLTARGLDLPVHHEVVTIAAVDAAGRQSLDPARQVAARHVEHMSTLEAARDASINSANVVLAELGA